MNKQCFKTVFSKRLGCLVAVGEHATSQGKANGAGQAGGAGAGLVQFVGLLAAGFASVSLAWAQPASNALPTGGVVAQGAASISTSGAVMNIQQSTPKAVVNWQSFDIGKDAKVNIQQPGADSVMLNRVTGANPSQIFGQLNANGQVVLVNPNGVLFGKDGSVSATSFTASTLGISDANFMAGNMQYERNGSTASVVNQGSIKASGGYVALLGASVSNEGKIETNGGTAYLAAAETVKVPLSGSGRIKLELSPSAINAQVANSKEGTIVTQGGQVYMQAAALQSAVASIIQSGAVDTTGNQGGAVHLLADGGHIKVDGSITANSTGQDDKGQTRKGGDIVIGRDEDTAVLAASTDVSGARLESGKGFVETSGHHLAVDGAQVIAKDWLLDPDNIDITGDATNPIAGYSKIKASDITNNLNKGTSVTIATTASARENQPAYMGVVSTGDGNIVVNADILKSASLDANGATLANGATNSAKLTLLADNGITLNKAIKSSSGTLDVTLTANGNAASATNSAGIVMANGSSIDANGGLVTLNGTSKFQTGGFNKGGLYMFAGTFIKGGSVRIDAKTLGTTGGTAYGAFFDHKTTITATAGDIDVTGTLTGAAAGNALFSGSNPGGDVGLTWSATGKVNISGDLTGSTNASSVAVQLGSMRINAGGDVDITAKTPNAGAGAIIMQYAGTGWNPAIKSGGNISILTNQGAIALNNFDTANTSTGLGITGNSLTIDNTGGQWVNGVYTKGAGYSTSTSWSGVQLNGVAGSVVVTGNVNIFGNSQSSGGNAGVNISAGLKGAAVSVDGTANTGNGIYSGQTIESTSGDVKMTGVSGTSSALSLQGAITASNNVEITGTNIDSNNASPVAYFTKAVTASNGTIRITADTAGSATQALNLNGATLTTTSGKDVTLTTDSINLAGNISAGAGTVTIQNKNAGVKIDMGGADVGSATATSRTLGLNATELGRISAAKTVIGSTAVSNASGDIRVNMDTPTEATTGDITLQTGSNINIDKALAVGGSTGTKNLTLNAAGQNSVIKQNDANAKITANQLNILGTQAAVALATAANQINQLNAQVKSLEFKNGKTLSVGSSSGTAADKAIQTSEKAIITTTNGDLQINQAIENTGSGDVVLGAGIDQVAQGIAGTFVTAGDLKTRDGAIVANSGKTYIYTGTLASAGALVRKLDNNFTELLLDDNLAVNTAHKDSSGNLNKIVNGLSTQVLVRENKAFDFSQGDNQLNGALLTYEYGTPKTQKDVDTVALWNDMQAKLIAENTKDKSTLSVTDASGIKVSIGVGKVIKTLTATSPNFTDKYSSSNFLKADTYEYSGVTTSAYTVAFKPASKVQVKVTPKELALTIDGVQTTYGTTADTGAARISGGTVGNDKVALNGSVALLGTAFSGSGKLRAGTYTQQFVAAAGSTGLTDADAGNYKLPASTSAANYFVTPKAISATVTAVDKVYDGNAVAALQATSADVLTGDQVSVGGVTGTFASKNVARDASGNVVAQAVTVSGSGANLGGNDGANYVLSNAASIAPTSAKITPKDLTVTGVTASDKVYDGTTTATISVSNAALGGLVSGDNVTLAAQEVTGNFASKNVVLDGAGAAASQTVNVTGVRLSGSDAGNYNLSGQSSAQAKILQRALTLTGSVAQDKSYDGNTTATVVPGQLNNLVAGESLNVSASGTFADAEAGSNKVVNATYRLANGTNGLASNYALSNATEVLRAAILSANRNPLSPIITPGGGGGGTRVVISGSGSSGAAVGVADDDISNRQECSVLHPEKCECEESTIPGIEMCYAPNVSLNNKD